MSERARKLELIGAFLREETTLALATTDKQGGACVAPLFYISDENLYLYWLSAADSVHSENLRRNPEAAATVYCRAENWKDIRGVQMRGLVSTITEPDRRRDLIKSYSERFKLGAVFKLAISQSTVYALRPNFFRYIDNSKGFKHKFEITLKGR
jgi:uncharacterized protein YhbP (UPF0306 family)